MIKIIHTHGAELVHDERYHKPISRINPVRGGGGGLLPYMSYIGTVCAAVKGMVFSEFTLEYGIAIREFWSRIGYHFPQNYSCNHLLEEFSLRRFPGK